MNFREVPGWGIRPLVLDPLAFYPLHCCTIVTVKWTAELKPIRKNIKQTSTFNGQNYLNIQ